MDSLIERLRKRLDQPLPGLKAQEKMTGRLRPMPEIIPIEARDSAVLQLIFPVDRKPHLLLIRRTEDGSAHSGQISFPGGRYESNDPNFQSTALREAEEEVGIQSGDIEVLGALTPLYIPVSFFKVHPFLAYSKHRPKWSPNNQEVAAIIEVQLDWLMDNHNKIQTEIHPPSMPGKSLMVPAYRLPDDSFIWGATAMMIAELEELLTAMD